MIWLGISKVLNQEYTAGVGAKTEEGRQVRKLLQ
jgi:hypothetical protein